MHREPVYDAVVVGSGPNGLSAAILLAQKGRSVVVFEAGKTVGGGTRSAELTLPGFLHDVCSAVHPFAATSPFFRTLPLRDHGLEWICPPVALAHPFDDGSAAVLERSIEATSGSLDQDAQSYSRLMGWIGAGWEHLVPDLLGPFCVPRYPLLFARFGYWALRSARGLTSNRFAGMRARGLFAGLAAHASLPLDRPVTAAFGLVLGVLAHATGWPIARGGSQRIADALASYLSGCGGEVVTETRIDALEDLPPSRAILLDVTPRQLLRIAGKRLPSSYRRKLENYRYGPGVFKIDWALDEPIPFRAPDGKRAGTVHLGGSFEEIAAAESSTWRGLHPEYPFVLIAQQSLFDPSRTPRGKQTAWGYCHVPSRSTVDMTERIERQVERFAPGFRDVVLERHVMSAADLEQYNSNYIGGDINGGVQDLGQLFTRPTFRRVPYSTPVKGLYLCSSSTPPGGGVHGMCGYHAARAVLRRELEGAGSTAVVV